MSSNSVMDKENVTMLALDDDKQSETGSDFEVINENSANGQFEANLQSDQIHLSGSSSPELINDITSDQQCHQNFYGSVISQETYERLLERIVQLEKQNSELYEEKKILQNRVVNKEVDHLVVVAIKEKEMVSLKSEIGDLRAKYQNSEGCITKFESTLRRSREESVVRTNQRGVQIEQLQAKMANDYQTLFGVSTQFNDKLQAMQKEKDEFKFDSEAKVSRPILGRQIEDELALGTELESELEYASRTHNELGIVRNWIEADLSEKLCENITKKTMFLQPNKLQSHLIHRIMKGFDVKCRVGAGSGKTAAFMVPIIQNIVNMNRSKHLKFYKPSPIAIIISDVHVNSVNVYEQGKMFGDGLNVNIAYNDSKEFNSGSDVLCSTLGRLRSLVRTNSISFCRLKCLIIDEADCILAYYSFEAIRELLETKGFLKEKRQTILISENFTTDRVQKLADLVLRYDHVFVDNDA